MFIKSLLSLVGILAVGLGVLGIFLPMLPTTPFLLLAAWCFARSSTRFHNWLLNHPYLGKFIKDWNNNNLSKQQRNRIITLMWLSMITSMLIIYFFSPVSPQFKILLIALLTAIGSGVSWFIYQRSQQGHR